MVFFFESELNFPHRPERFLVVEFCLSGVVFLCIRAGCCADVDICSRRLQLLTIVSLQKCQPRQQSCSWVFVLLLQKMVKRILNRSERQLSIF